MSPKRRARLSNSKLHFTPAWRTAASLGSPFASRLVYFPVNRRASNANDATFFSIWQRNNQRDKQRSDNVLSNAERYFLLENMESVMSVH